MGKPLVARIEVFDKLSCQASPIGYGTVDYLTATATEEITGVIVAEKLSLTVSRATYAVSALVARRILRVIYVDGTYDEYRIASISDTLGSGVVTVIAPGMIYELAAGDQLVYQTVAGVDLFSVVTTPDTPTNLLTAWVDAFLPSHWVIGTVTPTAAVSPTVTGTPLAVAMAIATASNEVATAGTVYELRAVRNGSTNYQLHLVATGATSATAYLRSGLNLQSLARLQDTDQQTTRGYPQGEDGRRCGDAWFKVTAVNANVSIDIDDINGGGVNPVVADDQFNATFYVAIEDSATLHQITDTDKANKRLFMNPTPASPVGKWVRICRDSSGNQQSYVDDPTAQATYGVKIGEVSVASITGKTNWAKNGNMADWTGSVPADWTLNTGTAPTKEQTVGLWLTGGQAMRYGAVTGQTSAHVRPIYCPAGDSFSITFWVYIIAFGVDKSIRVVNPNTGANEDLLLDGTVPGLNQLNIWLPYTKQWTIVSAGNKTFNFRFLSGLTSGEAIVDAVDFQRNLEVPDRYVHHSEAADLWLGAVRHLATNSMPLKSFEVGVADLTRADGSAFPSASLAIGCTIDLREPDELGIADTGRLLRVVTDHHDPVSTHIEISNRRQELTQLLATA